MEDRPEYIKDWYKHMTPEEFNKMDDEGKTFYRELMPLYEKYVGTNKLLGHIRNYINTHDIVRKDDFRFQLVCMWCDHIRYRREQHGMNFKAEDVFKIKIPKEILSVQ